MRKGIREETKYVYCPKKHTNFFIKTKPITVGADATVYVWFLSQIQVFKIQTNAVAFSPAVTVSVPKLIFRLLFGTVYIRRS